MHDASRSGGIVPLVVRVVDKRFAFLGKEVFFNNSKARIERLIEVDQSVGLMLSQKFIILME